MSLAPSASLATLLYLPNVYRIIKDICKNPLKTRGHLNKINDNIFKKYADNQLILNSTVNSTKNIHHALFHKLILLIYSCQTV